MKVRTNVVTRLEHRRRLIGDILGPYYPTHKHTREKLNPTPLPHHPRK